MKVIDKRYEDTVSFSSLKVGDVFLDIDSIIYMKTDSVNDGCYEFNAVNLSNGVLVECDDYCQVVVVEAEVFYR